MKHMNAIDATFYLREMEDQLARQKTYFEVARKSIDKAVRATWLPEAIRLSKISAAKVAANEEYIAIQKTTREIKRLKRIAFQNRPATYKMSEAL